jgi:hypothetical protein
MSPAVGNGLQLRMARPACGEIRVDATVSVAGTRPGPVWRAGPAGRAGTAVQTNTVRGPCVLRGAARTVQRVGTR